MVTNERQRQYASQSRKIKAKSKGGEKDHSDHDSELLDDSQPSQPNGHIRFRPIPRASASASPVPEIDPKLNQYHYVVEEPPIPEDGDISAKSHSTNGFPSMSLDSIKYSINIMKDGERIKPRFELTPNSCPEFPSLVQHIRSVMDDGRPALSIQVLGPSGLVDIRDQATWVAAIQAIMQTQWMDGEVKCVVEMDEI